MSDTWSEDEERDLITQIANNPEAFRRLYRHYFPRLYAYVAYRVERAEDAEDLVADIFVKIIEALPRFDYRGKGSLAGWLFKIAYHEVQGFYRRSYREKQFPLENAEDQPSFAPSPDEALSRQERSQRLQRALKSLAPRRQEIVSLRFFAELRNQEIAEILGLDERTVASHLARALADLQQKYQLEDLLL